MDGTSVNLDADPDVMGLPDSPVQLDQGEYVDFYVYGQNGVAADFEVTANRPIAVASYMTGSEHVEPTSSEGDPLMVQLSPVEQFLPRYVMLAPSTWINDYAVITRPAGASIAVDDVTVSDDEFMPVGNGDFEVARVPLPDGVHVFDGNDAEFSVIIVGFDTWDSYGYLGGTGTGNINPNPQN